jgi:hypothetical protein
MSAKILPPYPALDNPANFVDDSCMSAISCRVDKAAKSLRKAADDEILIYV